ncbi:MAG: glycosyltransferase family 4 protein [Candidatus Verstraetearchaeota archaeon]|jgi:glycosyltransferase involved in cell wall biosynthesis|nr:glycosyltransferase family 4 protein [Candidatus Verstraetearchaeota archaeon]
MKICFLSLNSYPILTNKNLGYAGGAEVEQVSLARELATHGYDIYFVTYHHGVNKIEYVNGIKIIKTYERDKADKMSVLQKYKLILSALKKANADIYFHESGATGVLPLFCGINRKKYVHRIASDAIVLSKSLSGTYSFSQKIADVLEIRRANSVIAQSNFQKTILKERFKVESVVIKNGLPLPKDNYKKHDPPIVLWVGSISTVKQPHLFVKLAKFLPHVNFEMIGGKGDPQLYEEIEAVSKKIPNLKFYGFIPFYKIDEYFRKASIFVNTSRIEGFPNTFIQAWAHRVPVVSLIVDPDGIIQNEKLGFRSGTFKQLISDVTTLLNDEKLRKTMGENARKYVEREHDIKKTVKMYIKVFNQLLI